MSTPIIDVTTVRRTKLFATADERTLEAIVETTSSSGAAKPVPRKRVAYLRAEGIVWLSQKKSELRSYRITVTSELLELLKLSVEALANERVALNQDPAEEKRLMTKIDDGLQIGLRKKRLSAFKALVVMGRSEPMWIELETEGGLNEIYAELSKVFAEVEAEKPTAKTK